MAEVLDSIALYCGTGGSNKVWGAAVVQDGDTVTYLYCNGAVGTAMTPKIERMADSPTARKHYEKKVREKRGKGYVPVDLGDPFYGVGRVLAAAHPALADSGGGGAASYVAETVARDTRVVVSRVLPVDESRFAAVMADPAYGLTEKANGKRVTVEWTGTELRAYNRKGQRLPVVPRAAESLPSIGIPFLIDGEDIPGGGYVMFDLLEFNGGSIRHLEFASRIRTLARLVTEAGLLIMYGAEVADSLSDTPGLALLSPVTSTDEKHSTLQAIRAANGEGVILRRMDAPSVEGNSRDELKYKFTPQIDAAVIGMKPGRQHGSLRLGLYRPDGSLIEIGFVYNGLTTADLEHITQLYLNGQEPVLAVSFLQARTVGIRLVEPTTTIADLRTDKRARDCTTEQLIEILGADRAPLIAAAPAVVPN